MHSRTRRSRIIVAVALFLGIVLAVAQPAFAAKGGGRPSSGNSSLSLVLLDSTDGVPHWGQRVTFDVQTTETDRPQVDLNCYQGGTLVYGAWTAFYDGYPWPWTQVMTLKSDAWTGGDADCVARLYYQSGRKTITAVTLSFHVAA